MSLPKKLYYDIDLVKNNLLNAKLNPLTSIERLALGLGTSDEGYATWDSVLKVFYIWTGTAWSLINFATFLALTDTPNTYTGQAGKIVRVNSVEDALEFHTLVKADVGLSLVDNTPDTGKPVSTAQQTALDLKVDKVTGKQLSTEDYTTSEKNKLAGIEAGAQVNDAETDPIFTASPAFGITAPNISNWNTAFGWGNHAGLYPLLSGSYANPSWITSLGWSKITGTPTTLLGYGITDAAADSAVVHLAGTETITGAKTFSTIITGSVSGNAGTVTNGVYTTGSYSNPSWITALAWSKITGTPTTLAGYGITDAVSSSSISGTTNYVARFTSTTALGTGLIRDDGSNVGINTAPNATYILDVSGNTRFINTLEPGFRIEHTNGNYTTILNGAGSFLAAGQMGMYFNGNPMWSWNGSAFRLHQGILAMAVNAATLQLIGGYGGSTVGNSINLITNCINGGPWTATSGTQNSVNIGTGPNESWNPASGTAIYNNLRIAPTINTSGSYSGTVRGIYYNPTLTSTTGVTHTFIESTQGNWIVGGSGTLKIVGITGGSAGDFVISNSGVLVTRNAAQVLSDIGAQLQLNGTGFVKASGTTISYDSSTYLSGSGTTPNIPFYTGASTFGNDSNLNWDNSNKILKLGTTASAGGLQPSATNLMVGKSIEFIPTLIGPTYGTGVGGFGFRTTGELMAPEAFVWRARGYIFENEDPQWVVGIDGLNRRMFVGVDASLTFVPQSTFEVNGGMTLGTTYAGSVIAPAGYLMVQDRIGIGYNVYTDVAFNLSVNGTVGAHDYRANMNGSNTYGAGANYLIGNASNSVNYVTQLDGSNNLNIWYYNGTPSVKFVYTSSGTLTLGAVAGTGTGNLYVGDITSQTILASGSITSTSIFGLRNVNSVQAGMLLEYTGVTPTKISTVVAANSYQLYDELGLQQLYNLDVSALTHTWTGSGTFTSSITATAHITVGGTSSQFVKGNGSLDSNVYLTSYTETDTLSSVTGRGATTTTLINANGGLSSIGTISSTAGDIRSKLNGSNSAAAGAFYLLGNTAGDRFWLNQLNASNGVDQWYFNGSIFSKLITTDTTGATIFSSSVTASTLGINGVADNVKSAAYTPSITNTTNLSSPSVLSASYMRIGSFTHVSMAVQYVISGTGVVSFSISLPIASNFTGNNDAHGSGGDGVNPGYSIAADSTNDVATVQTTAAVTGSVTLRLEFMYEIK